MPTYLGSENSDFILVNSDCIEQAQEVTEANQWTVASTSRPNKDFVHLRLNPTQLNNLNLSYLVRFTTENNYTMEEDFVDTGNLNIRTYFKHLTKDHALDFFVFQAVCDVESQTKVNRNNLAFINDVIKRFKEKYPQLNATLLFPLNLSRINKRHSVLLEIIKQGTKITEITLHNSQSKWTSFYYPNCLKDLGVARIKNRHYQMQKDDISCGFFVHFYIKSILENKNSSQLNSIFVTLKVLVSNSSLLEDTLNENFVKKYPDARKITASGEALSWEKIALEAELDETFYQTLSALDLDFLENSEKSTEEVDDQKMVCNR